MGPLRFWLQEVLSHIDIWTAISATTSRFAVFLPVDKRFVRSVVVDNPFLLGREGGLCFDQKIFNVQGGRDAGQRHSLDPVVDNCPNHNSQAENTEHFDDEEDLQRHQALVVVRERDLVRNGVKYFSNCDVPTALKNRVGEMFALCSS